MVRSAPWLPIGVLAVLVALTFWLNQLVQPGGFRNDGSERHDPDLIVENFTARKLGPDGSVRYILAARRMMHYPDDDSSRLESVSFEAANPDQPRIVATSDRGQLVEGGDQVIMEGNVVINADATNTSPPWKLTTPKLTLQPDDNLAQSSSGVKIESPDSVLEAADFVLNTETRIVKLNRIKATLERPQK
jgi:lipopolysaccharide export system protein LptC